MEGWSHDFIIKPNPDTLPISFDAKVPTVALKNNYDHIVNGLYESNDLKEIFIRRKEWFDSFTNGVNVLLEKFYDIIELKRLEMD